MANRYRPGNLPKAPEPSGSARIWIALGLSFMVLGAIIVAGAIWFVDNQRISKKILTSEPAVPVNTAIETPPAATALDLTTMSKDELLKMVPVYARARFSSEAGEGLPDDMKVFRVGEDQYLMLLGTRQLGSGRKDRLLSIFKLDDNQLSDITKNALPMQYAEGRIGDERAKVRFFDKGADLEIAAPMSDDGIELIEECSGCEPPYRTWELNWCGNSYEVGARGWRNDPFTVCYQVAQALESRTVDARSRPVIDAALDAEIAKGFYRDPMQLWKIQNLSTGDQQEAKNLDAVSYKITNETQALTVTVTKQDGQWRATAITRE